MELKFGGNRQSQIINQNTPKIQKQTLRQKTGKKTKNQQNHLDKLNATIACLCFHLFKN